jgi:S1-C subfamily serine protease
VRPALATSGAAAAAASLALALSACGGGGGSPGGEGAGPGARGPGPPPEKTRVRVIEGLGKHGKFDPAALYRELAPGVVTVVSQYGAALLGGPGEALGSGFVLDAQGYIATNAHVVVGDPPKLERAKAVYIELGDGNRVPATIVGTDIFSDVALLKIDPRGLTLTPLRLGSDAGLEVGEPVAAIGSPFGEVQSLSVGVISALHRSIDSLTNFKIGNAIQTDAAINHGNSGGPLLDAKGHVLGINSQIQSTGGGGEGVGFAVPVGTVRRSLAQLRRPPHKVRYAYLGVTSQDLWPLLARRLGLPIARGALVVKVESGGPARKAGLSSGSHKITYEGVPGIPTDGDAIASIDGRAVKSSSDVGDFIAGLKPGNRVTLGLVRGGSRRTVTLTLGVRPEKPATQ